MENNTFTLDEIEQAMDIYCSSCCLLCDECGLKDFIIFELPYCLAEVMKNE